LVTDEAKTVKATNRVFSDFWTC